MGDTQTFRFVAEILKAGEPCGMGILVASDRVLTCAHVVNLALERSETERDEPSSDASVEVRFPFYSGGRVRGAVHRWYAPDGKQEVNDCCVLALRSPQVLEVEPAHFAEATPGREFQVPCRTGPRSPIMWVYGTIGEASTSGLYQVNKQDEDSDEDGNNEIFIGPGCSGGPVIDDESGHVLGMVVWANPEAETAHIAPTQTLERACPLLKPGWMSRRAWLWSAGAGTATAAVGGTIWWKVRKPTLRIGIKPFVGYAPLVVAQRLGLCRNVEIEFNDKVETVVEMKNLVRANELDAGLWLSCTHGLFRSDSNPVKAKAVLKLDHSKDGDAIVVRPGIEAMKDLKGQPIAIQKHDAGDYMFRTLCKMQDFDYELLKSEHASPAKTAQLCMDNKVAAATTYEPFLGEILKNTDMTVKWTAKDLGRFGIVDILAVNEVYLASHEEAVKGLIDGWYDAVARLLSFEKQAVDIAVKFLHTHLTPNYGPDDLKAEIDPAVVELADKEANRKFFTIMVGGRSEFMDHYDNSLSVFWREAIQPFSFNERDIPDKFHR